MQKYKVLLILIVMLIIVFPLNAQDDDEGGLAPDDDPIFATITLQQGFSPDPWLVTILAGGTVNMAEVDGADGCLGGVGEIPDVKIEWLEDSDGAIRLFFNSLDDTTIVVQTPDGEFICNDDNGLPNANPLDPAIILSEPVAGIYNVWIGTYLADRLAPGYLVITEFAETFPGQIVSSLFGTIVEPD